MNQYFLIEVRIMWNPYVNTHFYIGVLFSKWQALKSEFL